MIDGTQYFLSLPTDDVKIFHSPGLRPERDIEREKTSESRGNDSICPCYQHVPFNQARNNQKVGEVLSKNTHHGNQENHQSLPEAHPLWNELHLHLV